MNNHHSYCECEECRDKRHIAQLKRELIELSRERDALRKFAQRVEPVTASIAFNNRPHSQEFRDIYDVCVDARDVIYPPVRLGGGGGVLVGDEKAETHSGANSGNVPDQRAPKGDVR